MREVDRTQLGRHGNALAYWSGLAVVVAALGSCGGQETARVDVVESDAPVGSVSLASTEDVRRQVARVAGKPLLVNIWATWCAPCVHETPALAAFYRDCSPRGVEFLSLSIDFPDEIESTVRGFVQKNKVPFPVLVLDGVPPEELAEALNIVETGWDGTLPATFFFSPDGSLRQTWFGTVTLDQLATAANKAVST